MSARRRTSHGGAGVARARRALRIAAVVAAVACTGVARGEVPGPARGAALRGARRAATDALDALVARLPPSARRSIAGIYVAFDERAAGLDALAACDDD